MKTLTYIFLIILAIHFVLLVAWLMGVFEGVKLPMVEKINLTPTYEQTWTDDYEK